MFSPEGIDVNAEHLLNPTSSNEDYQSLFVRNSIKPTYACLGANYISCSAIFSIQKNHIVCT